MTSEVELLRAVLDGAGDAHRHAAAYLVAAFQEADV